MVLVSVADALVSRFMATLDADIVRTIVIPGHDHQAEMDGLKMDLRSLDFDADDYDERHADLRAQLAVLKDAPATPDEICTEATGQSYGQMWDSLPASDRGNWLRSAGITCGTARTDTGLCEAAIKQPATDYGTAKGLASDDGVSVLVAYPRHLDDLDNDDESI
jgi:hypothetical protein